MRGCSDAARSSSPPGLSPAFRWINQVGSAFSRLPPGLRPAPRGLNRKGQLAGQSGSIENLATASVRSRRQVRWRT